MKKIILLAISIAALALLWAAFFYLTPRLPSKVILWQASNQSGFSPNLVKDIFSTDKISILVLGQPGNVEGQSEGGQSLTDTIMAVQFNPSDSRVFVVSIPRDIWVLYNGDQMKINEVLERYGAGAIASKVEELTGIYLDGYVVVDLSLIKNAVDYLGGVDVTLSKPAVDKVSGYTLSAGFHHLNGDDAVWLIRNRFDPEGDFFREKNQQQIIGDLFYKFSKLSTAQKLSFIDKFVVNSGVLAKSDLDESKLASYAIGTDLSKIKFSGIVMSPETKLFQSKMIPITFGTSTENVSVLLPTDGFEKYDEIRSYIKSQMAK